MLRSYLTIAFRSLWHQKGYSLLNIAGLGVGLCAFILLFVYIRHELSYDRFHPDADRLYRVVQDVGWAEGTVWSWTGPPMGPLMAEEVPEVERFARVFVSPALVSVLDAPSPIRFEEGRFAFADPSMLRMFGVEFLHGSPVTALADPASVILTVSSARKLFGTEDAVGNRINLDNQWDLAVTGVIADLPQNTHLAFDYIAPYDFLRNRLGMEGEWMDNWWYPSGHTYVHLSPAADVEHLNQAVLPEFIATRRPPPYNTQLIPRLQPVTGIHLYGNPDGGGVIAFIYIFAAIAAFILLIAAVNYMNLATARAARRSAEVGVRKVLGAQRRQVATQFLGEAAVTSLLALALAIILAEISLPMFRNVTGLALDSIMMDGGLHLWLILSATVIALLAGSYPAAYLSAFPPIRALVSASGRGAERFRKVLIISQFSVSIVLIVGAIVAHDQLRFMQTKSLGFDTDELITVPMRTDDIRRGYESFRHELLQIDGVHGVTGSNWTPGVGGYVAYAFSLEGADEAAAAAGAPVVVYGDHAFLRELGMEITHGRPFSEELAADVQTAFLLNESATHLYGVPDAVGRQLRLVAADAGRTVYEKTGTVIGVVSDFHLTSLHAAIRPTVVTLAEHPRYLQSMLIRVGPEQPRRTLAAIESAWNERFPERPFEYTFLDDRIRQNYANEARFATLVSGFAVFAIFIACLGLFGLAAYAAERRTKEIGIRKVMGASIAAIIGLLSKDFAKLVIIAAAIAAPVAYVAADRWLTDFAYRIAFPWWAVVAAATAALLVALLSVSSQALRAATRNPVEALRDE